MRIEDLLKWFFYIVIATLFGLLLLSAASCQMFKASQETKKDSTAVHKVDSGRISTVKTDTKDSLTWGREIFELLLSKKSGDTTIINNVTTPVRVIREWGSQVVTDKSESNELVWRNAVDSLSNRITELSKTKETSPAKFIQIAIGMGLVFVGLVMLGALVLLGIKIYRTFKI